MRRTIVILCVLAFAALAAFAEAPQQWAGVGLQWSQDASPQIAGMAVYARRVAGDVHPTYSFSLININSAQIRSWRPFDAHVSVTTETGAAQHITRFRQFDIYALGTLGMTSTAVNTGFSFSGGGTAQAAIGRGWTIGPTLRYAKSAIVGRYCSVGVLVGLGGN